MDAPLIETPPSRSAHGEPLHTRSLDLRVIAASPDRVEARAILFDIRKQGFLPMVDDVQTAGLIHDMRIQARIDPRTRTVEAIDSQQAAVVFEPSEATHGESCRDPAANLENIVGHAFDDGMRRRLGNAMGGPRGCSHLLTLAHTLAQVVPRAFDAVPDLGDRQPGELFYKRTMVLDGFDPGPGELELVVQQHDFTLAPLAEQPRVGVERLTRHDEIRAIARVELASRAVKRLAAAERTRTQANLSETRWRDLGPTLAFAEGAVIVPGLGGVLIRGLAEEPAMSLALEALLHLSPGFIQCPAAMADRHFTQADGGAGGAYGNHSGGMANSCYIWREEGELMQIQRSLFVSDD